MNNLNTTPRATRKAELYKTARTRIACAGIKKGEFVSVLYSCTDSRGQDWYLLNGTTTIYPAKHLTDFVL